MTKSPEQFIEDNSISMLFEFVPFSQSRHREDKHLSLNWRVTVLRAGLPILNTEYMQGIGHLPKDMYQPKFLDGKLDQWSRDNEEKKAVETGIYPHRKRFGCKRKIPPPDVADVLNCLVSDASALDYAGFEDWATEYGFDSDSRKAETIYRQCLDIALKLRASGIDLDEAQEVFADY